MSTHVKKVSDVARSVTDLNARAQEVADHLRASIQEVYDGLDTAQEMSHSIRSAGAELRGILGTQTNGEPRAPAADKQIAGKPPGDGAG